MPHKAIDLPPEVARRFVEDMPRRFLKATVLSYVRDVTQMIPVQDRMQLVDNADARTREAEMGAGLRWSNVVTGLSSTFGLGSSLVIFPDVRLTPFNIGIGCVCNSTSAITAYSVEHSFDYTGSSAFISSNATWFQNSTISAASSNLTGNYAFPVSAIRLNVTAGSSVGTVTFTVIQAGGV
jgi:hypothetical protein